MKQRKTISKLQTILYKVKKYAPAMAELSDKELSGLTLEFRRRLKEGETLDNLLPEAYAAVCEADKRILGKFPYDAQILGAIAMHQGKLVEMNTGEGKTLVATMPLYLNGLTGNSNILLTTNEYLALRDVEEMGPVYEFMGLTVAAGVPEEGKSFTNQEKQQIYQCDIVYTTHGIFGFDYLLNNLVTEASERFMRELSYVIIDEADSVLLDSAQTPLVISGSPRVQSNLYELADFFVTTLIEGRDYIKEDKKVWLTEEGSNFAESFFRIDNFYSQEHFEINRHVILALRAHALFEIEKEYVISKDKELQLLDSGSGRMMPGVKLRGGQHQALECKEKLEISRENRSVASITYQNLFLLFPKMSGMSGTISDAAEEIAEVYGTKVVVIPPNCPVQRKDLKDFYYKDKKQQFSQAIATAIEAHSKGQPVLIVVSTIAETEHVSSLLMKEGVPHNVLNANNAYWEAEIIKEAGQLGAVTVATSMAGRGTDIRLGEGVKELGGLAVIGIGRMANIRQERQARGRAGRQGDPGFSRFFVSLQDEVVKNYGLINWEKYENGKGFITKGKMKKVINQAQKTEEEFAVISRRQAMAYDQVLQRQRALIYATRDELLEGGELDNKKVIHIAKETIDAFLKKNPKRNETMVSRFILDNISYSLDDKLKHISIDDDKLLKRYLVELVWEGLSRQEEKLGSPEQMKNFIRIATLQAVDDAWVEQVDYLQQLQSAVMGRASAQRNPVYEYHRDGLEAFYKMERRIKRNIIRNILLSNVYLDKEQRIKILLP